MSNVPGAICKMQIDKLTVLQLYQRKINRLVKNGRMKERIDLMT